MIVRQDACAYRRCCSPLNKSPTIHHCNYPPFNDLPSEHFLVAGCRSYSDDYYQLRDIILAPWQLTTAVVHEILSRSQKLSHGSSPLFFLLLFISSLPRLGKYGRTRARLWSGPWKSTRTIKEAYCTSFIDWNRRPPETTSTTFCTTATAVPVILNGVFCRTATP